VQLLDVLREFGVNTVFGIPGGPIAPLYAALLQRPDIRVVTSKHESSAAFCAMGYALATGRPGVVLTTAGPGITNAVTGLASAHYEGLPVVMISGEVARSAFGRGALQEGSPTGLDSVGILRRLTKFSAVLERPGSAQAVLRKALTTAFSGRRGAVFVSLPLDVAEARAVEQPILGNVQSSFDIDSAGCGRAFELLANASRPLILAGGGARSLTARRALRRLAERIGSPVAVTTKGKGVFPEDHPLYLGLFGFGGHDSVTEYLEQGLDVVMAAGTGLNDFATNAWSPLLQAKSAFIHIDIDAAQLGRNYRVDLGLVGPLDAVVGRMLQHPLEPARPRQFNWGGPVYQRAERSTTGALTTPEVMSVLNECCAPGSMFTADMGEHLNFALHYLRVPESSDFFACLGFGSMGSGICTAIGYQFGLPSRRTFAICGDGGFLMYGSELATAVQHKLNVAFVIINDSRLNMVHHGLMEIYGATPDFSTQVIDFAALARSFGARGAIIKSREDLRAVLAEHTEGPLVLDVRTDPSCRMRGNPRVAAIKAFKGEANG
jgi:acetolactate synthase-1/2/3 large subunit